MDVNALAKLFVIVQMTFPPIPPSSEQFGIGKHPELGDKSHSCLSMWCCTLKDCRPLAPGSVKTTSDGYIIPLPDGRRVRIPFDHRSIRQASPECQGLEFGQTAWACYNKIKGRWNLRCFYPRRGAF